MSEPVKARLSVDSLKQLATNPDQLPTFIAAVKASLIADFEGTLAILKSQKLLTKTKRLDLLQRIASDLNEWLDSAPLSGKRKALLRRHLQLCERVQIAFSDIDRQSASLDAWSVERDSLLLQVLGDVEREAEAVDQAIRSTVSETSDILESMERRKAYERRFRDHCDYALEILRQAGKTKDGTVNRVLTRTELQELFKLADLYQTVQQLFDQYSFHGWQAKVSNNTVHFWAPVDEFAEATSWAESRTGSDDWVERRAIKEREDKLRITSHFHRQEGGASNSFEDFLASSQGKMVLAEAVDLSKLLGEKIKEKINEIFDLTSKFQVDCGTLSFEEVLNTWLVIYSIVLAGECWNYELRKDPGRLSDTSALVPLLNAEIIKEEIATRNGTDADRTNCLFAQFSCQLIAGRPFDLFLRPLLQLNSGKFALPIAFVKISRIERNIFTIAERVKAADLSPRGFRPLARVAQAFRSAGFLAETNVPVFVKGKNVTDIDLVLLKGEYLYLAQVKVAIEPDGVYENWKLHQTLLHGADQLGRTIESLDTIKESLLRRVVGKNVNLPNITDVIPFLLTNSWSFTGTKIQRFPVVDFSYLKMLLNGGTIEFVRGEQQRYVKVIKGNQPTESELAALIRQPFHRAFFQRPQLVEMGFEIGGQTIYFPGVESRMEMARLLQ
jgi:hypothetical protein